MDIKLELLQKFKDGSCSPQETGLIEKAIEITKEAARGGMQQPEILLASLLKMFETATTPYDIGY